MNRRLISTSVVLFLLIPLAIQPAYSAASRPFVETQTLRIKDPGYIDDLGYSIDAGGGYLISGAINVSDAIGNDVGAAFVYRRSANGTWLEDAQLMPDDGAHNDAFGTFVGIDGQSAIVGVPWRDDLGSSSGAAYIFAKDNTAEWNQFAKLIAPDGGPSELFGSSVGLSGNVAVVGAFRHDDSPAPRVRMEKGAVYVYEKEANSWDLSAKLQPIGAAYGDHFGYRVAVHGEALVATAPNAITTNSNWDGAAYLFRKNGNSWLQVAKIVSQDTQGIGWFGVTVALGQGRVLIGAQGQPGTDSHGGAYIFEQGANGVWNQTAQLIPHDIGQRNYGLVALDGDFALLSAGSPNVGGDEVVYVFQRDDSGNWSEIASLTSLNALHSFGTSLGIDRGTIFVGSGLNSPGAVHVFPQVPEPTTSALFFGVLLLASPLRGQRRRKVTSFRRCPATAFMIAG